MQKPCTFKQYPVVTKQEERKNERGWTSVKKNMTPSERREAILNVLCKRRQDTVENLAHEFGVSVRTIKYDIEELTLAHPIETVRGRYGGGVKVADGYYIGRKYLKPKQQELLKKLSEQLAGDDLEVMNSIFRDFAL